MSTGVIFILGKGVTPILAYGVKSTWPQGSSAPGFSTVYLRGKRPCYSSHIERGFEDYSKATVY